MAGSLSEVKTAADLFGRIKDYLSCPKLVIDGCSFFDEGEWRELYVNVANKGKSTARGCRAQLYIAPSGPISVQPGELVTSATIRSGSTALNGAQTFWKRSGNPIDIDIHPLEHDVRVVVARARSRSCIDKVCFTIPGTQGYRKPLVVFNGKGFEYLVKVHAENLGPAIAVGRVLWSANNPTIELSTGLTPAFIRGHEKGLLGAARRMWSRVAGPREFR